jgi:hypothetical protein
MTDIYADARIVAQRHREEGAAEERSLIADWLRTAPHHIAHCFDAADAIEAKEHLK